MFRVFISSSSQAFHESRAYYAALKISVKQLKTLGLLEQVFLNFRYDKIVAL